MGGLGSDAAIEAADIVIMDDRIEKVPLAVRIARRTVRIAWQNIILHWPSNLQLCCSER